MTHHPDLQAARRRGRPRVYSDEQRRKTIVDEARRTFIDLGYRGTTTAAVAARCNISKQTLYEIFPSKAELFLAVVGDHRRMMLDLPRPAEEDEAVGIVLEKIFMIDIDEDMQRERDSFITFVMQESAQFPELFDILMREGAGQSRTHLREWLDLQVERGKLDLDDTASAARMLMDMLLGPMAMASSGAGPGWRSRDERREHLCRCIAFFVRGGERRG